MYYTQGANYADPCTFFCRGIPLNSGVLHNIMGTGQSYRKLKIFAVVLFWETIWKSNRIIFYLDWLQLYSNQKNYTKQYFSIVQNYGTMEIWFTMGKTMVQWKKTVLLYWKLWNIDLRRISTLIYLTKVD